MKDMLVKCDKNTTFYLSLGWRINLGRKSNVLLWDPYFLHYGPGLPTNYLFYSFGGYWDSNTNRKDTLALLMIVTIKITGNQQNISF